MSDTSQFGEVKSFKPGNFPQQLRLPEGTEYVEPDTEEGIRAALDAGYAVYVQSCDGRAFVWPEEGGEGYLADRFFFGPARQHRFESVEEAASFAAGLCE